MKKLTLLVSNPFIFILILVIISLRYGWGFNYHYSNIYQALEQLYHLKKDNRLENDVFDYPNLQKQPDDKASKGFRLVSQDYNCTKRSFRGYISQKIQKKD